MRHESTPLEFVRIQSPLNVPAPAMDAASAPAAEVVQALVSRASVSSGSSSCAKVVPSSRSGSTGMHSHARPLDVRVSPRLASLSAPRARTAAPAGAAAAKYPRASGTHHLRLALPHAPVAHEPPAPQPTAAAAVAAAGSSRWRWEQPADEGHAEADVIALDAADDPCTTATHQRQGAAAVFGWPLMSSGEHRFAFSIRHSRNNDGFGMRLGVADADVDATAAAASKGSGGRGEAPSEHFWGFSPYDGRLHAAAGPSEPGEAARPLMSSLRGPAHLKYAYACGPMCACMYGSYTCMQRTSSGSRPPGRMIALLEAMRCVPMGACGCMWVHVCACVCTWVHV